MLKHRCVRLRALGLEANFITNATTADLKRQIDKGRPTPCGWLHQGHVSAPSGGGHYSSGCWLHQR